MASGNPMTGELHTWTEDALLTHSQFVRRLARTLARDEHEAEDLAQETWLLALRKTPELREGLRPWLARVLRGLAFTRRRSELRRSGREDGALASSLVSPAADRAMEDLGLQQSVVSAVLSLSEPYRATILLRYYRGLPASEIARETNSPLETVRTRLRRAQEMLRLRLDGDFGDRRSLCLALAALGEPRALFPVGTSSSALTLVIGTIMSWKSVAVAIALASAGVAFWALGDTGGAGVEPGHEVAVTSDIAALELDEAARLSEPSRDGSREIAESGRKAVESKEATAPRPGIWLVGQLLGRVGAGGDRAQVSIGTMETQDGLYRWDGMSATHLLTMITTELVIGEGYEIDLSPVFRPGKYVSELHVQVRHDGHLPLDHRLVIDPRSIEKAEADGRVEIETQLVIRPVIGRVEGTVTIPYGLEPRRMCAALVPFDAGYRPKHSSVDVAVCDESGRFELATPDTGRHVLVAWEESTELLPLRPVTQIIEIEVGSHLQTASLHLTRGDVIEGAVAAVPGETRVHSVKAILVDAERLPYEFGTPGRSEMEWVEGEFELRQVTVHTDSAGSFSLPALGQHLYAVSSEPFGPSAGALADGPPVCRLSTGDSSNLFTGLRVRAPAEDISLGVGVAYAGFQVFVDGLPATNALCDVAQVMPQRSTRWTRQLDDQGRVVFSFPPGDIEGWVLFSAPGWAAPRAVHINENARGYGSLQPIHLEPVDDPVGLSIRLELWADGETGAALVILKPWHEGEQRPDLQGRPPGAWVLDQLHHCTPTDGVYRLPKVTPGRFWCTLRPMGSDQVGGLPWRATSFELLVPPGKDMEVTHTQGRGGHLRVLALDTADQEGLLYVLSDPEDGRYCAILQSADGGAYQTKSGLDPGDYILLIMQEDERRVLREIPVTLIDGEVKELELESQ